MAGARTEVAAWELRVEGGPEIIGRLRDELRERGWHPHVRAGTALSCCFPGSVRDEAGAWGMVATRRGLHLRAVIEHQPVSESPVQVEARRLAGLGHRVVELHGIGPDGTCTCGGRGRCRPGKHPRRRDWSRGTDPADTRAGSNLGVVLGDLVVVDFDGPAAEEVLGRLVAEHGPLPDGYAETRSGRPDGGRHLYFRAPPGMVAARVAGLEILAGPGHYAVVPPSTHVSGRGYAWVRALGRVEELPWAPAWLLAPVEAEVEPDVETEPWTGDGAAMLARAVRAVAMCPPPGDPRVAGRNTTMCRWAYTLGGMWAAGRGSGQAEVEDALLGAARICGLVEEDGAGQCRATIWSGWRTGVVRPLHAAPGQRDPTAIHRLAEIRVAVESACWPGAAGATRYRVAHALLNLAESVGRVTVRHSHRQIAQRCSIPRRTVSRALRQLVADGWLRVVEVGVGRRGTTWDIYGPVVPRGGRDYGDPAPGQRVTPLGHDAWTGLPTPAPMVVTVLRGGPMSTAAVAEHLGTGPRQARRVLHRLVQAGLVRRDQGICRLTDLAQTDIDGALDAAAARLGCVGAMAAMCTRHREERAVYQAWWDGRERCRARTRTRSRRWCRHHSDSAPESETQESVGARAPP